ncbi:MAG: hypothetical protein E7616_06015 [Ruminococcaceae bacterium]|nr:hypothetical protein [Oscillospiraceae bacterium]
MNRIILQEIVHSYGRTAQFPQEAIDALAKGAKDLPEAAMTLLDTVCTDYQKSEKLTYAMQEEFEKAASPVHIYTAQMLFYMANLPLLEEKYRQKGLQAALFDRVLFDLRAKLFECKDVYDIWGSFVAIWFARFFNFSLYGIERLEFAPFRMEYDYTGQGVTVKKGDFAIDVHIPSGAPLSHGDVLRSYQRAAEFFNCRIFVCESWMLYPAHREMLNDCPNLMAFFRDYDVVEEGESRDDLWRIFGAKYGEKPENLPRDTALRRVYADRLEKGLPIGWGKGILVLK